MDNQNEAQLNTKKVLIAEDERAMASAMEIKLQKSGLNAHAVFNGIEALAELQGGGYSLILLDLMMPEMDGWEVLKKIKESNIQVKIIVTSNLSQEEDKIRAKDLGALDFLVKSDSSISSIVDKVKGLL